MLSVFRNKRAVAAFCCSYYYSLSIRLNEYPCVYAQYMLIGQQIYKVTSVYKVKTSRSESRTADFDFQDMFSLAYL